MCDNRQQRTDAEITDEYIEELERRVWYLENELTEAQLSNIKLREENFQLARNNNIFN